MAQARPGTFDLATTKCCLSRSVVGFSPDAAKPALPTVIETQSTSARSVDEPTCFRFLRFR